MEISGLIVTVGQGAGYRTVAAGLLLITGVCRRLTLSLVWRLVTALAHRRQSTVCSTYDVDYNNAMQDYWRIYTVEPSTCQSYRIYVSAFCMNAANDDVHVCPVTTDD